MEKLKVENTKENKPHISQWLPKTRHKNTSNKDLVNPKTRVLKEHHDDSEESTHRQEESPQVSLLIPTTYKEQWQFNNKETSQWKIKQDPNSNYSKELYQQPSEQQNDPRLRRVIRSRGEPWLPSPRLPQMTGR